jgi:hypothetical protein
MVGFSVRTVQRAVAALRKSGLIETPRNPHFENEMRVCLHRLAAKEGNPCQTT